MRKISGGFIIALAAIALAGCSASEAADAEAVQQWLTEQSQAAADVDHMSGLASEPDDERTLDGALSTGEAVRIDYDSPQKVSSVEFACFGAETMDASVYYEAGSGSIGTGATDVRCADGPITIDVGEKPLTAIAASGISSGGHGAWSVTMR